MFTWCRIRDNSEKTGVCYSLTKLTIIAKRLPGQHKTQIRQPDFGPLTMNIPPRRLVASALSLLVFLAPFAVPAVAAPGRSEGTRLRAIDVTTGSAVREDSRVYIVQFVAPPAVAKPDLRLKAASSATSARTIHPQSTSSSVNRRRHFDADAPAVQRYAEQLTNHHDAVLADDLRVPHAREFCSAVRCDGDCQAARARVSAEIGRAHV